MQNSIWIKITSYTKELVEVARETDKMIFFPNGKRVLKIGKWESYHPTKEAAIEYIQKRTDTAVTRLESKIRTVKESCQEDIAEITAL